MKQFTTFTGVVLVRFIISELSQDISLLDIKKVMIVFCIFICTGLFKALHKGEYMLQGLFKRGVPTICPHSTYVFFKGH